MENIEYATEEELEIFYKLQKTLLERRQKEEEWAKRLSEKVKEEKIEAKMTECFQKHKDISIKLKEYEESILKIEDENEHMKQLYQERNILANEDFELIKAIARLCPNHTADSCMPSPFDVCVCSKHWKQYRKYH